jgi:hypothetical protein
MKSDLDLIWEYLERDLREEEMGFVEKRLNSDPAFRQLFDEQEEILRSLQKTETIALRKKLQQIRLEMKKDTSSGRMIFLSYPWFIAAAVGLLCITTGYVLLRLSSAEPNPPADFGIGQMRDGSGRVYDTAMLRRHEMTIHELSRTQEETAQNKRPDNGRLLAAAYEVNPLLEKLVEMHFRNVVVKDVLPENGETFASGSTVWFTYRTEKDESVCLSIMDNQSGIVFDTCLIQGGYKWNTEGKKGLFYFQLSADKKIICTRKILIR